MGKKLVKSESDIRKRMVLPNRFDILGIVDKNFGFTRMRGGDVVLVSPWEFEYEEKGDSIFRYTRNQAYWLREKGILRIG